MKKILLLAAVFTAVAYGSGSDLRVIESTNQSITLEFTPHYDTVQTIVSGNDRFELCTFSHGATDEALPGMPDTRFITVPLALPGAQGARIEILKADYESVMGFNQAPVPSITAPSETNPTGASYVSKFSNSPDFYPLSTASIANTASIHGWVVGYLKLYPLQYQAAGRVLKKCTRMVVRVTYGARDPRALSSGDLSWARVLLNYPAAKSWYAQTVSGFSKKPLINSVRAAGQWFKMEVADDGMVKIDAAYLKAQGVDIASLSSIRDIKIFGGSGRPLNTDMHSITDIDLSQCAVYYADNHTPDKTDDYGLFYAQGANGWLYDPSSKQFSHSINPFVSSNYYLMQITPGGVVKEMQALGSPSSGQTIDSSLGMVFFDEDKYNFNESGQLWVGAPMSDKLVSRVVTNRLIGYAPNTPVTYKYDFYAAADAPSAFTIQESDVQIGSPASIYPMTAAEMSAADGDAARETSGSITVVPALSGDRSTVRMTYTPTSSNSTGYINWLEILYQKQLVATSDELFFPSPDMNGPVQYPLTGFSTNSVLGFDVTDIGNVKTIDLQLQQQLGTFLFRDNLTQGGVKKYWIGAASAYKSPKTTIKLPNTNLHGAMPGAEFLIITHHDFAGEAQRLKAYKETLPNGNALTTMVVDVDSIYNEFGNGTADPTALRNFLLYASQRWQISPQYVLLFGDASYDYKGIASADKGWVPTYETEESNNKINSYCMDDYLGIIDSTSSNVAVGMGRICVRSAEEARFAVDRIIGYERNSSQDQWKNTVTIVADDEWVGPAAPPEPDHTRQAEALAQQYTPKSFDIKKIFIADYATVFTPQGRRKPDARLAIIDQVNRGTLLLNFTGHGNPSVWAHESIFTLEDTKMQFFNPDRLTFVCAATCDWGRFDKTAFQSSAEEMIKNETGGAIGVLSATRAVYSTDNAALNYSFYHFALPSSTFDPVIRLGDAIRLTKNDRSVPDGPNKLKYHLLCDPTLRLAVPSMAMMVDTINGIAVASVTPDTLSALQKVTVKATIRRPDMTIDQSVSGKALVTVFDADQNKLIADFSYPYTYVLPGAVLYKGENSVVNGKLDATFIVPKDIAYQNRNGKISVYFASDSADGRGYTTNFVVGGTSANASTDTQGPSVSIYFDSPSFKSGDVVGEEPKLIVNLSDSSGINSAGTGIGHRIEAWVDNSAKSIDLTEYYKSKRDSYQEGTVEYPFPKFDAGPHSIVVKAWDVYNNPSTAEAAFVVASGSGLSLMDVYNIPNPVRRSTTFTFQHNQLSPVDVQIKIYSVAGRLIAQIDRYAMTDRFVQIPWDCRDNDGDPLGNGVYFSRIIAKTSDGKFSSEALGKLAVVK